VYTEAFVRLRFLRQIAQTHAADAPVASAVLEPPRSALCRELSSDSSRVPALIPPLLPALRLDCHEPCHGGQAAQIRQLAYPRAPPLLDGSSGLRHGMGAFVIDSIAPECHGESKAAAHRVHAPDFSPKSVRAWQYTSGLNDKYHRARARPWVTLSRIDVRSGAVLALATGCTGGDPLARPLAAPRAVRDRSWSDWA
jgi:hypothetical protein